MFGAALLHALVLGELALRTDSDVEDYATAGRRDLTYQRGWMVART